MLQHYKKSSIHFDGEQNYKSGSGKVKEWLFAKCNGSPECAHWTIMEMRGTWGTMERQRRSHTIKMHEVSTKPLTERFDWLSETSGDPSKEEPVSLE